MIVFVLWQHSGDGHLTTGRAFCGVFATRELAAQPRRPQSGPYNIEAHPVRSSA